MAKPKLALIPAAQGTSLYSVLPSSGVGDFHFTRSGSATRINSQGLIETVASGVSRLNYPMIDGVVKGCPHHILEPQRTNLITYSNNFSNADWIKQNVNLTSNYEVSPDGTLNADRVITTNLGVDLYQSLTVIANTTYKLSFYVKLRDGENIQARFYDESNLSNISYVNYSSQLSNNEWKRVELEVTTPSACTSLRFWTVALTSTLIDISIYGAQLEQGSYPTSYIPTTSAAVTRSAETANGSGDASTFNDSEGVLMFEGSAIANDGTFRFLSLGANSSNGHQFIYSSVSNSIIYLIKSSGADRLSLQFTLPNALEFNKFGLKYKQNDFALWINGIEVSSSSVAILLPTSLSKLNFDSGSGASDFYGNTKQIQYFDSALNDSDLEKLTSWVSFSDMANGQLYTIE